MSSTTSKNIADVKNDPMQSGLGAQSSEVAGKGLEGHAGYNVAQERLITANETVQRSAQAAVSDRGAEAWFFSSATGIDRPIVPDF